jgi:hypothetical protein
MMSEEKKDKPIYRRPLKREEKTLAKIQAGLEAKEKARKEPLLSADELKKILEEKIDE